MGYLDHFGMIAPLLRRMDKRALPPPVVTYCGSTSKCQKQFDRVRLYDTIRAEPRMFFTIGCSMLSDAQIVQSGVTIDKDALDELHFWKIRATASLAIEMGAVGEVCILDITDEERFYIGESTMREMRYAEYLIATGSPLTIRLWSEEQEQVKQILRDIAL